MNGNKHSTGHGWIDPDDAPDLSAPEWQEKLAKVRRAGGRPKLERPKVSTTLRLDADVVERFRASGRGWQSRINTALKEWLATH